MSVSWVWPQLETQTPPPINEFDAGFGPVYLNDQIVLQFSPSSYTGTLTWYCDWSDSEQGAFWNIPNTGSPLTYTFNETTPDPNDISDVHTCHFYNLDGTIGNSQTFQYFNFPGKSRTLWTQNGPSSISTNEGTGPGPGSSSPSPTPSPTASPTSSNTKPSSGNSHSPSGSVAGTSQSHSATNSPAHPSGTSSSSGDSSSSGSSSSSLGSSAIPTASRGAHPDASATNQSGDPSPALSTGAAVGITIAAIVALLAIGFLAFFLRRRMRRSRLPTQPSAVGTEVTGQHGTDAAGYHSANVGAQHGSNTTEYYAPPPPSKPMSGTSMQQTSSWNGSGMGSVDMVPGRSELSSE